MEDSAVNILGRSGTSITAICLLLVFLLEPACAAKYYSPDLRSSSLVSAPSVIFQAGNAASNTIFTNSTSARVTTPALPTSPALYFPTSYNIVTGTYSSGTVPGSVNATDSNYFITGSVGAVNPQNAATEFIFSVTTAGPVQLNLTIVQQYDKSSASVTIQIFNYTGNAYPTSGQGYSTYTSSGTAGTDETQQLTVTSNPQFYTSAGQVKVKISASRNASWNQKANLVRLHYYHAVYDYVLKIVNQQATAYNIKLDTSTLSQTNIGRISNFTAWFHNPASTQLQALSGSLPTQTGPTYTLGASATVFLAVRLTTTSSGLSTIDSYLRIYPTGSTTTHTDYRLTFNLN
ncbi:hypothetical protein E6H29_07220 [Candidatus Bathyarchaeota archaeon]|nr:MAG: hypothetical protein E6H29_07220 [Candidatus Bathyarchaeota archaeon]